MAEIKANLRDHVLRGMAGFRDETPWHRAPQSFEDWKAGAEDTPEQLAYWKGYHAGLEEALHRARQKTSRLSIS